MSDVNANIGINFDTDQALAQLRQLQAGLSRFNQSLTQGNVAAMNAQKGLNDQLVQAINATGKFVATQKDVATSTSSFTQALEKNQLSMREYFRYTGAAATANTKVFKNMFAQEREIINRARKDRVKLLQSQYIQMQAANGDMIKVLQVIPKHLKMVNGQYADYATRMQMAAQRQQFLNQLLKQGSTQLLNFGKNTQWAGRQLMVGLTIPLSILGSTAAKTFMEMEQAVTKFARVYGDMTTGNDATNKAVADIQRLGKEFTKYGIAVKDTVEMAATAAAMGLTGNNLNAQVIQATRLAVLGQVEQQQALETTISLTNAFGIASEDLAKKINFLNAVENQTVLSIEDLTIAVPKAGPVIKQLGGSVEDLAFFMTAMKEGGINASEGANALKSGLASMINPSKKASEFLAGLGINIKGLVEANKGDLKGTVVGFARALDTLDPLNRARAIEQLFGKFQFARLSTLFQNVTKDSSQAARALGLAGASVEELAILSERELGKVEDMTGNKFKKSMENIKLQLIPLGKAFLQAATPIINFVGRVLEKFNGLGEGTKKIIAIMVGVIGGLAPIALMTFGILMNGVANAIKLFAKLRGGVAQLNGSNNVLGGGFEYLTNQQIENLAQSNALHTSHSQLISTFNVESAAVQALGAAYANAASQARALAQSSPGLFNTVPGPTGAVAGLPKYAKGKKSDVVTVGGTGNKDTELALLTPGETVISAPMSEKYGMLINAMIDDKVAGYAKSKRAKTPQQQLDEYDPTIGSVTGGVGNLGVYGGSGIMSGGNTSKGFGMDRTFFTGESQGKERGAQSVAGSLYATIQELEGKVGVGGSTVGEFEESFSGINDIAKEIFNIFAHGYSPNMEKVSELSEQQLPIIQGYIDNLLILKKITEEQHQKLSDGVRKMFAPELGTYDSPGRDAAARGSQRTETTLDENGQVVVKRSSTERTPLPGRRYLDDQTKSTTQALYERAGLDFPTSGPDKLTFAHTTDAPLEEVFQEPEYRDKYAENPSEALQALKARLAKQRGKSMAEISADPNLTVGEGTVLGDAGIDELDRAQDLISKRAAKLGIPITAKQEDVANAETAGKTVGEAVVRGLKESTETNSPSKKGIEVGKDIADGIAIGLQEGTPKVASQSEQLGDAAVPKRQRTAAETQARVDKMDLTNKAFYDDLNTPELLDERQVLKSQDRQRRKLGATTTVDSVAGSPAAGSSSLTISAARAETAAQQLAVKTEEAVQAESQVVQQIRDESKTRTTIKGNTINIGKAREEADKAENEAAVTRARAAALEKEQAKQKRENSPTTITDAQVIEAKEKANAAELEYARVRQQLAEAGIEAAQPGATQEVLTQDPVKAPAKVKKAEELISNGTVEQGDGLRRIVDGTNDTADSTLLVADQTDELATVTGEAVDAQTQTAGNLLTGADITDATTGNLNDVLQSTGTTGIAQDDFADSSQNIAETNEDILKLKKEQRDKLIKYNADEAARLAALNGTIPAESQTDQVVGKDRMDVVEAYEEAMGRNPGKNGPDDPGKVGYTKNKKGHLLFDPETGQPTTMSEKEIIKKKRGMRKEKVGKVSGKAAGALGTATMVAGMVGAPPQVTAALGTAATVAQFAPMIAGMGPIGLAVAGIAAVGVGLFALNKKFQASYAAQAKFVRETSASTKKMADIGAITGKVGASEIMARKRSNGSSKDYIARERAGSQFGDTFLQSDVGKGMSKALQANIEKNGPKEAVDAFGTELAAYVQDGVLTATQAQDIARQIGINFKDTKLGIQIDAQLSALIGPNGEDLQKDPMVVGTRLIVSAENRSQKSLDKMLAEQASGGWGSTEAADLAATDAVAVQMAQMQADVVAKRYDDEIRVLETQLAQTSNKQKQIQIEKELSDLKLKSNTAELQMNNLVADATDNAIKRFEENIQYESTYMDAFTLGLSKIFGGGNQREAAYIQSLSGAVTDKYANTEQATQAQTVQDRLAKYSDGGAFLGLGTDNYTEAGFSSGKEAQSFEVQMKFLMANGTLTPNQETALLDLFEGNLPMLQTTLDIGTRLHGAAGTAEMMSLLTGINDREYAQQIALEIATKDNDTFEKLTDMLGLANMLDGKEINLEVVLKQIGGVAGLEFYVKKLDALETKIKGLKGEKITLDTVATFTNETGVAMDQNFLDYVNTEFAGDSKKQANAIRTYTTIYQQLMSMDYTSPEAREFFRSQAQSSVYARLQELQSKGTAPAGKDLTAWIKAQTEIEIDAIITKVKVDKDAVAGDMTEVVLGNKPIIDSKGATGGTGGGSGTKEDPLAFLESLAMRIKMVRDQSFNAKKPIESMLEAFNKPAVKKNVAEMFKLFDGLQQKLIALKVPEEFRDYIAGLDAKQLDELLKADLDKKKKGQQGIFTYAAKKDKKGNVVKDKKGNIIYDRTRIAGITQEGKAIVAAYREAPLDKFNIAQTKIIADTDNQFKAFNKLKAAGIDTSTALEMVADSALAGAIASKQYDSKEIEKFAKDVKNAADATEKAAVMADLLKKNADFKFKTETFPKLASSLKVAGLAAEDIATILQDPALAKQLMADLEDGKIDSKAIADYLNSIKGEKILEIRAKFNAGDFAAAAAPGMELVNKMFAAQEQLIRTGVDKNSKALVANVKTLKDENDRFQLEIQRINLEKIRPIEKAIEKAQRDIELNITRKIDAYQEEVSDLQRVIEIAFERPIAAINAENTIMSNDMEIMNHAAEEINKRYDEQAEALSKVSEIKSQLVAQEKEQLDLADALSKGDIAAAARAVQAIRAAQAARNAENASKALEQSRKNKIDSLTGRDSGLTKDQILERQYQNAQSIYDLENRATTEVNGVLMTRLQILEDIKKKSDEIYKLEEDREAAQLKIQKQEDAIYNIKRDEIAPLEDAVEKNSYLIARDEYAIEQLVRNVTVLGQTKDYWDGISAKIEASAVAGSDFDNLMGSMLASTDAIEAGWSKIESTFAKYSSSSAAATGTAMDTLRQEFKTTAQGLEELATKRAADAKAAIAAAEAEYKIKKEQYDLELKAIKAAEASKNWWYANMLQNAFNEKWKGGAPVAPVSGPTTAADNPNVNYNDLSQNNATDLYNSAKVTGPTTSSAGGSSGGSGGGSGSSSTVPSPGTKTPPTTTTTVTGTTSTGSSTVSGVSEDKVFSTNSIARITNKANTTAQAATTEGLTAAADKIFKDIRNIQLQIDKDFPGMFSPTEHIQVSSGSTPTEDQRRYSAMQSEVQDLTKRAALRKELDKILKLKEEQRKYFYGKDSAGKTVPVAGSNGTVISEKKKLAVFEASQALSADAKELLDMLKNRNEVFKTDKAEFDKNRTAYADKAKTFGFTDITKIDLNALKKADPKTHDILLPLAQSYAKAKSTMEWRELAMNKARKLLEDAGYTKSKTSWYFGTDTNAMTRTYNGSDYAKWKGYATGGLVSSRFAQKEFRMGSDTVPAMLTPGEFVMNKFAVQTHGVGKMKAINSGSSVGDSVYNYSISVNVKSESNPDEIARTVIAQIKSTDAQRIRGVRV